MKLSEGETVYAKEEISPFIPAGTMGQVIRQMSSNVYAVEFIDGEYRSVLLCIANKLSKMEV